jgi:two-component system cell cycle response regulator
VPWPVGMLAHSGGMLLVAGASIVTVFADTIAMSFATGGDLAPSSIATVGPIEKLLMMCSCGAVVYFISKRFSCAFTQASQKAENYLKKLYLQGKENATALSDAESCVQRVRHDVDMYSSLVLLLEEAAEKIYSHLDTEELIETFFLVLRKCLGADAGAIYFIDEHGDNYVLHSSFGYGPGRTYDQPEVLPANDPLVEYVTTSRRAIALYDSAPRDPQLKTVVPKSSLNVAMAATLLEQDRPAGIVTINRFRDNALQDHIRDTALVSMLCNITSIAFTNARLFMKIQDMADRDPLTKVFNRRYFYEALGRELSTCHLRDGEACVLLCDIDHFKVVNDTFGHQVGDAVLIEFANTCRKIIRDCDVLARYGGEEFIFLMPGLSVDEGRRAAERVRRAVDAMEFVFDGKQAKVTVSCGVASFPQHACDVSSLTQAADLALYQAKASGRNKVVVSGASQSETIPDGKCEVHEMQHTEAAKQPQGDL